MFMLFSLLLTTLVSSECVDLPNWGCELVENPEYCNGLQLKKCPKACAQCTEEPATEAPPTPTEAEECQCVTEWKSDDCADPTEDQEGCPRTACDGPGEARWCLVANPGCAQEMNGEGWMECDDNTPVFGQECVDLPNWGCELVEKPEYCNGLQLKKCPKACAQCGGEESKEEEECTETFEPVCTACQHFEDCNGMTYKIEYRGEGESGKFGCTYPKTYEYVNSGDGCPEPEVLPECDCGKNAVEGEEKFQSGSADGDKMCQFGANCATFFEGCDGKGAKVCSLKIEYVEEPSKEEPEELPECDCGKNAVKGEERFQSGSADGDKMCQFGANCATFFEGCDGKGAKVCSLKIEYVEESEESPEPESEESPEPESEEPEELCSRSDCLKPCKGRRNKRQCQVAKNSECADKKGRGRKKNRKFFSKLACQSKAQVFMTEPAAQAAWTAEDALVYGFALVGLVALGKGALAVGRKLQGEEYKLVEADNSEL